MFNAEKLLGKIVGEVLGTGHGKKSKKRGSNSLMDSLTSGAGLMTAIGLGVGAFEIFQDKKQQGQIQQQTAGYTPPPITSPPVPPTPSGSQTQATPPPLPGSDNKTAAPAIPTPQPPTPPSPAPDTPNEPPIASAPTAEELAITMIQVMIAAAHADGTMDDEEEKAVLDKLKDGGLDQEEKMFLLNEMHNPKSIQELTQNITDPAIAKAVYILAVSTINIDTPEERSWLDELAQTIGISKAVQSFIDEQY